MKKLLYVLILGFLIYPVHPESLVLSKAQLRDKIKGAWAGQVIGCTFGGPTEFRWQSTLIHDYVPLEWDETKIAWWYENAPGLYDDVYMDLTFVQVFEEEGLDAPASSFARAFAYAEYPLWHANNMARYNIKKGILPPDSGHWLNNPHADDIDYQIEADFSGIMTPGMPNSSAEISDRIGHIMNYGDGWYGGVYVGAMYSLAFVHDDLETVVREALEVIPAESAYYQIMRDVIRLHSEFPGDWKRAWFEIQRKWGEDVSCPDGVFRTFNIDATINSAWVLLGLLYGEGDFSKTLEIATRSGDDSDCNPASAGGILGCFLGYDRIPPEWRKGLKEVEDRDFKYTEISLNKAYDMSYGHALETIRRGGGKVEEDSVEVQLQNPRPVRLERGFAGHHPVERRRLDGRLEGERVVPFQGVGFAATGSVQKQGDSEQELEVEMWIDGKLVEVVNLSTRWIDRRETLFWKYQLPRGKHEVRFKVRNPVEAAWVELGDLIVYDRP